VPIRGESAAPEKRASGSARCDGGCEFRSRFFLKSLDPTDINREVLHGT